MQIQFCNRCDVIVDFLETLKNRCLSPVSFAMSEVGTVFAFYKVMMWCQHVDHFAKTVEVRSEEIGR